MINNYLIAFALGGSCVTGAILFGLSSKIDAVEKTRKHEKDYQEKWCKRNKGKTEHVLKDRTRVDCLTKTHAIEFDFGKKWSEAIGQSLFYALHTGKRGGIVLILRKKKDYRYWVRLNTTIDFYNLPIDTWKIGKGAVSQKQQ